MRNVRPQRRCREGRRPQPQALMRPETCSGRQQCCDRRPLATRTDEMDPNHRARSIHRHARPGDRADVSRPRRRLDTHSSSLPATRQGRSTSRASLEARCLHGRDHCDTRRGQRRLATVKSARRLPTRHDSCPPTQSPRDGGIVTGPDGSECLAHGRQPGGHHALRGCRSASRSPLTSTRSPLC